MSIFDYFKSDKQPPSANIARDRLLQILISHPEDNSDNSRRKLVKTLKREILEVIAKHINVNEDSVNVNLEKAGKTSILELNVTLPDNK
ncbi:MAG TPA: cell division topological specificity factor MinE [Gammaproteobacteria bacterium]|nr:cell division topological specificity factor MinE [Gammaproteobacteria bacterium]